MRFDTASSGEAASYLQNLQLLFIRYHRFQFESQQSVVDLRLKYLLHGISLKGWPAWELDGAWFFFTSELNQKKMGERRCAGRPEHS